MLKLVKSILIIILLSFSIVGFEQEKKYESLKIGDNILSTPAFKNLKNYHSAKLSLGELRGKLVILDFWSTGCTSCIQSIPHLEELQKKFNGKIQIILINPWESKNKIEERVSQMKILRRGIGLTTLPIVLGDTIWRYIFPHFNLPHHVWIDKEGKVIASTSSINATAEHIQQILNGFSINLSEKKDLDRKSVRKNGLLIPADTSIKALYYSGFFQANNGYGGGGGTILDSVHNLYKRTIYNASVPQLVSFVAHGNRLLFQLGNYNNYIRPSDDNKFDDWFSRNCYSYEIGLPINKKDSVFSFMLQDLNRFFSIERNIGAMYVTMNIPSYVLTCSDRSLITSQRSDFSDTTIETQDNYELFNEPFSRAIDYLKTIEDLNLPIAFIDESKIDSKTRVSIKLPKSLKDKNSLRNMLLLQGLDLNWEVRDLKILVVKDSN